MKNFKELINDENWVRENFTQTSTRTYKRNSVELGFYGKQLSIITIDGLNIDDPDEYDGEFAVEPCRGYDDDIIYRLDDSQAKGILSLAGINILGFSGDGVPIYNHPEGHSHRPDLDSETICKININGRDFVKETVNLGRSIGYDHLVKTHYGDEIVFHQRGNRPYKSRMVLNRDATQTENVTIIICKCGKEDGELSGKYALVTLFEGEPGMPEPYGFHKDDDGCIQFWKHHALVPTEKELAEIMIEED